MARKTSEISVEYGPILYEVLELHWNEIECEHEYRDIAKDIRRD